MAKILHIITRMDMGGSAQNTILTCIGLSDRYELLLAFGLSRESKMTEAEIAAVAKKVTLAENKGVKCITLPFLIRRIDPVQDFRAFTSICKLIRKEKPDVVHTHSSKAGLLGRLAAWISGVSIIVHTPHGHVFFGHFNILVSKLFLFIEKHMSHITDRIIALTEGERQDYIGLCVSKPEKIAVVHSGVNIDQYMNVQVNIKDKKRFLGLTPDGFVVGTVGWLLPIKGPMHLLDAMVDVWQRNSNIELVYVGKGSQYEALKQQAIKMGVSEKVKFLGWRNDVHEIMQVFDLFVLPSLNEGMGRVLVEAMAAGKPVVGSRVGGIPDLIVNNCNGVLVEPGDVNAIKNAIEKLSADYSLRHTMGKRGRAMASDFSEEKMIDKIDTLYTALIYRKKSPTKSNKYILIKKRKKEIP